MICSQRFSLFKIGISEIILIQDLAFAGDQTGTAGKPPINIVLKEPVKVFEISHSLLHFCRR